MAEINLLTMATTRVHEDQENRITDIRRGKENLSLPQNQTLLPSKRAVLASLHNNCHQNTKLVRNLYAFMLLSPAFFYGMKFHNIFVVLLFNQ